MAENNENFSGQATVKKAQRAILHMAREWNKSEDTIHHAIKSFEDVVQTDPESSEASEARAALLQIAEDWDKKGRKYAAARLYKKLMASR
jgi:Tfp pilus assembly protein PilF